MRIELLDNCFELEEHPVKVTRHICADANWVRCPFDALKLGFWCSKPSLECSHRGGTEDVIVTEMRVKHGGEGVDIKFIDVFDIPEEDKL